ncbi:MAG: M56 family metallopeptidase [Erythrobacter sp.]
MTGFLFDTLVWTAALIALVLVLRRPVTRWFGAPTAYALWALPMIRLLLPPIELPAWLAPAKLSQATPADSAAMDAPIVEVAAINTATGAEAAQAGISQGSAAITMPDPPDAASLPENLLESLLGSLPGPLASLPWPEIALTVWFIGALVFLYVRFSAYFRLRDELVEGAREVGSTDGPFGTIRLIETPGTTAPLAFGVLHPVIALPPGFMAQPDRTTRDLALAHELAHHRGHDLLINVLVQPLFAMHWFNPLARYGWLALRRDQEAACDARVIASKPRAERALYATVIASFAAGPNVALAAPMACPVLGDKSIIHRLRSLKMTEQSSGSPDQLRRRRLGSRLLIGTAIVALPLTASISYAESKPVAAPQLTATPPAAPMAPLPPQIMASGLQPAAPEAPQPPQPPTPPEAPDGDETVATVIVTVDPDTGETETVKTKVRSKGPVSVEKIKAKDKTFTVITDFDEENDAKRKVKSRYQAVKLVNTGSPMSEEERAELLADIRESLNEADAALEDLPAMLAETLSEAKARTGEMENRTVVRMACKSGSDEVSETTERADGSVEVTICQSRIMAQALKGLREARKAIARNSEIQGNMRSDVLKELDQQIRKWERDAR